MTFHGKWIRVTEIGNIPPLEGRPVRIGEREVAIFNLNGRFVTIDNQCPHTGGPLCDGIVSGATVGCPLHGWHFALDTGMAIRASRPACVATYPTRVEDGVVLVAIDQGSRIESEESAA